LQSTERRTIIGFSNSRFTRAQGAYHAAHFGRDVALGVPGGDAGGGDFTKQYVRYRNIRVKRLDESK
jgi:hypothetical protein